MKLKTKLIGGLAALALCAASANADIVSGTGATAEYAPGTGALAGFDIFRLFAHVLQTGAESTATGFQSVDATADTSISNSNMKFKFTDLDSTDTTNDADVFGKTSTLPTTNTSTVGTFFRAGSVGSFNSVTIVPAGNISDPDGDGVPNSDPSVTYGAVKNFRVAGFNPTPDVNGINGNGGKGALFGVVVLPHNNQGPPIVGHVTAQVAADKGGSFTLNIDLAVPEPTSMGLIGLGAFGLLSRRRRQA